MSEDTNTTINDDEIDLLDLFIVLLKHRHLILGPLIGVVCLTLAGFFIYPSWQFENALKRPKEGAIMTLGTGAQLKSIGIKYYIPSLFSSAPLLLRSLKEAGLETLGPEDDLIDLTDPEQNAQALNYVRQVFVEQEDLTGKTIEQSSLPFLVQLPEKTDSQYFEIKFYHQDSQLALNFLSRLYWNANQKLLENIKVYLQALTTTGEILGAVDMEGFDVVLNNALQIANIAEQYLNGTLPSLELVENPYYIKDELSKKAIESSYKKKAIILIFAVFFLSIFLAFILELIHNIKEDEERMVKIRKALNKN